MDNIYIYGYSNIYGYYMVNIYGCPGPLISKNIVRNCLWSSPAEPCHHGQTGQLTTDFSNNAGRASRPKNISVIQGTGDVREVESSHNAKLRCHARYIGQIWVNQKANSMAQFLEITRICGWPNRVQGARVKVLTLLTTSSIATVTTNPPAFVTRGLRRCQTCSFICWERMVTDIGPMVVTYLGWNIFCFVGYPKFSISKSGLSLHFDWNVCIPMEKYGRLPISEWPKLIVGDHPNQENQTNSSVRTLDLLATQHQDHSRISLKVTTQNLPFRGPRSSDVFPLVELKSSRC